MDVNFATTTDDEVQVVVVVVADEQPEIVSITTWAEWASVSQRQSAEGQWKGPQQPPFGANPHLSWLSFIRSPHCTALHWLRQQEVHVGCLHFYCKSCCTRCLLPLTDYSNITFFVLHLQSSAPHHLHQHGTPRCSSFCCVVQWQHQETFTHRCCCCCCSSSSFCCLPSSINSHT